MTETTAVETTRGEPLLVHIDQDARVIRFADDEDTHIVSYSFEQFATVTGPLALHVGANVTINAGTVAGLKQYADLDA